MTIKLNPKPDHHRADIIRLTAEDFHVHTNADNLVIIKLARYQLVTRKEEFKPGDLAVFIQPDSVVPQTEPFKFIWESYVGLDGIAPAKLRRVTVRKFRGEWSEGLLMPLSEVMDNGKYNGILQEGQDVSDLLGITHYVPEETDTGGESMKAPHLKPRRPKTLRGWFHFLVRKLFHRQEKPIYLDYPTYDVRALKNMRHPFTDGERVVVTEKIHGSSARYVYVDGTMYAGSREQWKAENSSNIFRNVLSHRPWIEAWCRDHEGYLLYGEVVPTQGEKWTYGDDYCPQFFIFDIRTPDGQWVHDNDDLWDELYDGILVPEIYRGPFNNDLITEKFVGGRSILGNHIREGVVIRAESGPRKIAKVVSNAYLEKDSK